MSQSTVLILLPETPYVNPSDGSPYDVTGDKQPAAAYYLGNRDLQTVQYSLSNCTANVLIEASLATEPAEDDWFNVFTLVANTNASSGTEPKLASDAVSFVNIEGNFVYLRAKLENLQSGLVDFIKVSY